MKTRTIVILNDGPNETWSDISCASICIITDEQMDDLTEGTIRLRDLEPVAEIGLRDFTNRFSSQEG